MNIKLLIWGLALLLLIAAVAADAKTIYVDAQAGGSKNGNSWVNAYNDLQQALAAAKAGDEIWVADGTYKPATNGDRNKSFVMIAGVAIYGGFAGNESYRDTRNWNLNKTILSGGNISYHVVTGASNATLDGFTISDGRAEDRYGGGMITTHTTGLTVRNCAFSNNTAHIGGGMANIGGSPSIIDCTFTSNDGEGINSYYGGGMANLDASPIVNNCTFTGNILSNDSISNLGGGGIYNRGGSPVISGCVFSGNKALGNTMGNYNKAGPGVGGGMYNENTNIIVTTCTFIRNKAYAFLRGSGGGMNNTDSTATLTGCVFTENVGIDWGGGIYIWGGSVTINRCVLNGNNAADGAGINNDGGKMTITDSIFSGNDGEADDDAPKGGGICNYGPLSVTNCTFTGNAADGGLGSGGALELRGNCTFANCILWNDTASSSTWNEVAGYWFDQPAPVFIHCVIQGCGGSGAKWDKLMGTDGGGNLDADPLFIDASNPAGADGIWMTRDDGLRLKSKSPCINMGDAAKAPATDILSRKRDGLPEIGAYEFYRNGVRVWAIYE